MKGLFLLLPALLAFPGPDALAASNDPVGRVLAAVGMAEAVSADGNRRTLRRGSPILEGDALITGGNSSLQLRMEDGQVLSLWPGTELRLLEFSDTGADPGGPVRQELVAGGFRAIVGNNEYRLETSLGVVEDIHATYECFFAVQLWCGVYAGGMTIRNGKGRLQLGRGGDFDFVQVPTDNTAPIGLLNRPDELTGALTTDSDVDGSSGTIPPGSRPSALPLSQNPGFPEPAPIVVTPIKQ